MRRHWTVRLALVMTMAVGAVPLPASADDPFAYYGDYIIDPGKRLGNLALGMTKDEVTAMLRPAQSIRVPGGAVAPSGRIATAWPYRWTTGVQGMAEAWPQRALVIGFCDSNQKMFLVLAAWSSPNPFARITSKDAEILNTHNRQLRLVGGGTRFGFGLTVEVATSHFGQPVAVVYDIGSQGGARLYLYRNGATHSIPSQSIGAYNFAVCQ